MIEILEFFLEKQLVLVKYFNENRFGDVFLCVG